MTHGGHKTTLGEKREGTKENVSTTVTLPKDQLNVLKRETVVLQENHSDVSGIKTVNRNRERIVESHWVTAFFGSVLKN